MQYTKTIKQISVSLLFSITVGLLFTGCDPNRVYEKNLEVKNYVWPSADKKDFTVEITDTTKQYNIYVNVRHVDYYQYSNLWLLIRTTYPDSTTREQRMEIPLATDEGRWHGEGMGDIWDYSFMIQQGAVFKKPGIYTFQLEQNMRKDPLPGIMSMGIRVERLDRTAVK